MFFLTFSSVSGWDNYVNFFRCFCNSIVISVYLLAVISHMSFISYPLVFGIVLPFYPASRTKLDQVFLHFRRKSPSQQRQSHDEKLQRLSVPRNFNCE